MNLHILPKIDGESIISIFGFTWIAQIFRSEIEATDGCGPGVWERRPMVFDVFVHEEYVIMWETHINKQSPKPTSIAGINDPPNISNIFQYYRQHLRGPKPWTHPFDKDFQQVILMLEGYPPNTRVLPAPPAPPFRQVSYKQRF